MHRPPAASYRVVRSRWLGAALLFLWLLASVNIIVFAWLQQRSEAGAAMALLCLLAGIWALRGWLKMPTGTLRWDGEHLHWQGFDAPVASLNILIDMDFLVMLRLHRAAGQTHSVVLTSTRDQDWPAIRRVLVALAARSPDQPAP